MALTIISERHTEDFVRHFLLFAWRDSPGGGYSFDCDEAGRVDVAGLNPGSRESYNKCLNGTHDVIPRGVQTYRWSYTHPAIGRCACRRDVVLDGDTRGEGIDCECGRLYNAGGQELAPRSQWQEGGDY